MLRSSIGNTATSFALATLLTSCGYGGDDNVQHEEQAVMLTERVTIFDEPFLQSDEIEIDYSEETVSLLLYARGKVESPSKDGLLFISQLRGPDGRALINVAAAASPEDGFRRHPPLAQLILGADATSSLVLPQADEPALRRGRYRMKLAGTVSEVTMRTARRVNESAEKGSLDLNLFLVKGSGQTSDSYRAVKDAVNEVFNVFRPSGLKKGDVTVYDISEEEFASIESSDLSLDSDIRRLMLKADVAETRRAVNVFVVRDLAHAELRGTLLGLSVGVPAALTLGGTPNAGVVISMASHKLSATTYDVQVLGRTMAHEIAHSMGLFHTSEASVANGGSHDLISDTPECTAGFDQDDNGFLDSFECQSRGSSNFMFWTGMLNRDVTPGQAKVLLHSTVVRGPGK